MPIDLNESVARYILSKSHFSREEARVKHAAFMPPGNLRASVYRVSGLDADTIWMIGTEHVAQPRGRRLYGRGQLTVQAVVDTGLAVEPEEPPERHAVIIGWPADKDRQMELAQELAAAAQLILVGTI